jgi:molybdopterin converting factor small subunit
MSRISIQIYGSLKSKAGKERFSLDAKTAQEAVEKLCLKVNKKLKEHLYEGKKIRTHYIFLINGKVIDINRLNKIKLLKDDSIHIFSPVGGG